MTLSSFSFAARPLLLALLFFAGGCGGATPQSAVWFGTQSAALAPHTLEPAIVVGNFSGSNILKFALDAKGNAAPNAVISGDRTGIDHADNVALDTSFRTYASLNSTKIGIFASDAHGNAKPIRVISGPNAQLKSPIGVAVDSNGYLYVADCGYGNVKVFAPGAGGNVSPVRVLQLSYDCTIAVAVDKNNQLYVTTSRDVIAIFSPEATGNVLLRTITEGNGSGALGLRSIAVDGHGYLYVGNLLAKDIRVFGPNARGGAKPVRRITGSETHLGAATGLALDASNNLYATICRHCSQGSGIDSIVVFGPDAKGNVKPDRVIAGTKTLLESPTDLAIRQ